MAAEREMRDFTRGLFQGSPDLSVLTLAMVRRKYLAHVGRESLMREEKELLKQLVEEELLRMQLDDSSSNGESPNPENARDTPEARAEKRPRSGSNSSGGGPKDTARKKQRLDQGSEASSDGEDSGIDSRKPKLADAQGETGKSRRTGSWEDEGDSGAEETPDLGGTGRESDSKWAATSEGMKQPPRRTEGAKAQDRLGQKRAREAERRGDCGEQEGKANGGITAQSKEESGSESVEEEECKRQKQTGKTGARKAKRRSDSEEEGDSKKKGRMKAWGKEVGSDSEMEEKECQNRKGAGKKGTRKAGRWSDSEEEENKETIKSQREEESGSEEEGRSRKQAGKKGAKKAERRSDSEAEEVGSRKRGRVKALKGEGSGSEEEEGRSRKPAGKKGAKKAERDSESEEEERKPRLKAEEEGKARQRGSSETDKTLHPPPPCRMRTTAPTQAPGARRGRDKGAGARKAVESRNIPTFISFLRRQTSESGGKLDTTTPPGPFKGTFSPCLSSPPWRGGNRPLPLGGCP
ncbi:HIRA-interacting protein 3 [Dermochelys coriacea]|uniref:HIRA-interacting protein 3 n=1 Tax=Dermochelys coriacea TaxID=27794 RepID=UPI001CAA0CBA|nr:HIRA-interacting protein 3 [Dermochelys coriacea]